MRSVDIELIPGNGDMKYQRVYAPRQICEGKICERCNDTECIFHLNMENIKLKVVNEWFDDRGIQ